MSNSTPNKQPFEQPLVTFALLSYNQEQYIGDAILGALSQTYRPLEIIISDDCSADNTFKLIEDEYSRFRSTFDIRINRTAVNRGLTEHINEVVAKANGRLIVLAAGDDISLPARVEKIVARWAATGFKSGSIFSEYREFYDGQSPGEIGGKDPIRTDTTWLNVQSRNPSLMLRDPGCTHAVTKDSFDIFGNLPSGIIQEDYLLKLRSSLIGGVAYIPEPLVLYRQTLNSESRNNRSSLQQRTARHIRYLESIHRLLDQFELDCALALSKGYISSEEMAWAIERKTEIATATLDEIEFFSSTPVTRVFLAFTNGKSAPSRVRKIAYALFPPLFGMGSRLRWHLKQARGLRAKQSQL